MALLDVRNLTVSLNDGFKSINAIDKMSLTLREGGFHGLVGESGSGKTLFAKALMGALDDKWEVRADRMFWRGKDLLRMPESQRREVISKEIAIIFQEPSRSLDPTATIADQIAEIVPDSELKTSFWFRRHARRKYIEKLLMRVGIKNYSRCLQSYAHELSEGLCQKVMIAMAIARNPTLLIADEPTDAMESTTKVQILRLLKKLNENKNMSVLMISHDLEAVSAWANDLTILYSGQSMESGTVKELIKRPFHPYTKALFQSMPNFNAELKPKSKLYNLQGTNPPLQHLPIGCRLGPRCPNAQKECVSAPKSHKRKGHTYSCHFPINQESS